MRTKSFFIFFAMFFLWLQTAQCEVIPTRALPLIPVVVETTAILVPDLPDRAYPLALIHHESCITVRSKGCWNPNVRFRTSREEGVGLGQITRTFTPSGAVKVDNLGAMRKLHPEALSGVGWGNIYNNPDAQVKIIALQVGDLYHYFKEVDPSQRLPFVDSAYNGGLKALKKERGLCRLMADCDPNVWWGNVERYNARGQRILYAGRSAYRINRDHVQRVWDLLPTYQRYLAEKGLTQNGQP